MHQGSGLPMKLVTIIELIKPEVQYHVMRYALNKTGWGIFFIHLVNRGSDNSAG